ncbi:MAG: flagellar protein FlgN [Xanthomonadaceae bacterium]|nr:flagellar protein FlgN [Xanthomonadaceae bacterium]MDE2247465.1 flagellar protein FlgN [Xanthomonadaceae bacterium]
MSRALQGELDGALQAVIADMQTAVDELDQALEAERGALSDGDSEALNAAGAHKQALMLKLEQLDTERLQLSRHSPAEAARLEHAWQRVVQCLRSAQQHNQRNGQEVAQRLRQVRQALSILTGHTGEAGVYGRAGELSVKMRSRVLAEA